ncbi:hypothetical protein ACHQM5_028788 [Ranunculus cassubicifolius]
MSEMLVNEDVEKRINSLLAQLQSEAVILDKIVYKGKNQHRRGSYFQYLLKVRRDTKLLISANLEEILKFVFQYISGTQPNKRAKKRKINDEKHYFQMRLLGVARLLSQMVEPMFKAAIEFSKLLARTFFMDFSLVLLALIARLRTLVQQILLDLVSVYNMFSSSQGSQSSILSLGGVEVVREYHPSDNDIRSLECVWEKDKFVLLEKTNPTQTRNQEKHVGDEFEAQLKSSNITYQKIGGFLGDDDLGSQNKYVEPSHSTEDLSDPPTNLFPEIHNDMEDTHKDDKENGGTSPLSCPNIQTKSKSKVAFVTVGQQKSSQVKESGDGSANSLAKTLNNEENSFFSLLTSGQDRSSIF